MRFWLDPQWARHYYSAGNQHLVFVPHYQALFPPVHVWEQAASDRHWGDALRQFLLEAEAGPVPEYAERIYVCETLPETLGRRPTIEVTVLNKAELKPLHVQLGWLNEQLLVAQRAEVEHYVQVAADSLIQEELAQAWLPRAEAAQAEFNRVAAATRQDLQATLEKLLAEVSAEMAAQVAAMQQTVAETRRQIQADTQAVQAAQADTQQTRADMQRLQARLKALHQTHSAMQGRARQMDQLEQQAATEAAKVEAAVRDLKARIEVAAQARMAVAAEVAHELEQLQDTRATLRRQLAEFRER